MATRYIHKNLNPPEDMLGDFKYYNPNSRLLVLESRRGKMLSRFIGPQTPDARRFTFQTVFCPDHNTFEGNHAPSTAPADVNAFSHAVEKTTDPTQPPTAAAATSMTGPAANPAYTKTYTADAGMDVNQLEQSGLTIGLSHIEGFSGTGGGFKVDGEGVSVVGGFNQPNTQSKGMTAESPLFGLIPKTVVTFFASDYLPDLKKLQQLQKWVRLAIKLPDFYTLLKRYTDRFSDLPDTDRGNDMDGLEDASPMPGYRGLDDPDRSMDGN